MQQFCPKIILNHFFHQKALILIALAGKMIKNRQKLKMAIFYVNCTDSYSILRLRHYLQGKKCADMWSYITECNARLVTVS